MIHRIRMATCMVGIAAMPATALAQGETAIGVDVTALAGYSSNPFYTGSGGSGYGELRVRPIAIFRTERNTLTLLGDAQIQQYFRRYSTRENYNARLSFTSRRSERLTLNAGANYTNVISGAFFDGGVLPVTGGVLPVEGGVLPGIGGVETPPIVGTPDGASDIGLFGLGNRRQTFGAHADAALRLSAADQVSVFVSGLKTDNNRAGLASDYSGYGGGLSYSRQLNDRLALGATGSVNRTDYSGSFSTNVYTLEGTIVARLSERVTLNGRLGASRLDNSGQLNDVPALFARSRSQTVLSGLATLCRRDSVGQLCVGGSRAFLPSSFGGARVQTSVQASYSAQLNEVSSVTASSAYTSVDGSGSGLLSKFRYWTNTVSYNHRLSERLAFLATGRYRDVDGSGGRQGHDVGGSVGVSYALGRKR